MWSDKVASRAWSLASVASVALLAGCPRQPGADQVVNEAQPHDQVSTAEQVEQTQPGDRHAHPDSHARVDRLPGEGAGGQSGHEHHGGPERYGAELLKQIQDQRCEHEMKILDCDACRYEVGVVEISPGLLAGGNGLVRTAPVSASSASRRVRLNGEVAFDERKVAHVSPRIPGTVRRVFAELGDRVKAGDRLLEVDSLDLGRLRAEAQQAKTAVALAKKSFERESRLFEQRISSEDEKLKAEAALHQAQASLRAATQQLRLLGFSEQEIRNLNVDDTGPGGRLVLRAPIAGAVVDKHAVPGERLVPEHAIFTIADLGTVWIWAALYERDLAAVVEARQRGPLPAVIELAAFPGRTFSGVVDYVGATMDETTRTVRARIAAGNKEGLLRPGMFAEVWLDFGASATALVVPAEAVVEDEDDSFVFIAIGDRRFARRDVKVGAARGTRLEILDGLSAGEQLVVQGAFLLKSDILREKMGAGCAD